MSELIWEELKEVIEFIEENFQTEHQRKDIFDLIVEKTLHPKEEKETETETPHPEIPEFKGIQLIYSVPKCTLTSEELHCSKDTDKFFGLAGPITEQKKLFVLPHLLEVDVLVKDLGDDYRVILQSGEKSSSITIRKYDHKNERFVEDLHKFFKKIVAPAAPSENQKKQEVSTLVSGFKNQFLVSQGEKNIITIPTIVILIDELMRKVVVLGNDTADSEKAVLIKNFSLSKDDKVKQTFLNMKPVNWFVKFSDNIPKSFGAIYDDISEDVVEEAEA